MKNLIGNLYSLEVLINNNCLENIYGKLKVFNDRLYIHCLYSVWDLRAKSFTYLFFFLSLQHPHGISYIVNVFISWNPNRLAGIQWC